MRFEIIAVGELKPDRCSRFIQRGIMADYSHIAVMVTDPIMGVPVVYEATGKGIHRSTLEQTLDNGGAVIRHRFTIPVFDDQFALGWLAGRIGTAYSMLQWWGFAFPFLRKFKWIGNGRAAAVCSELGADFLVDCARVHHAKLDACDWISPTDLVYICQEVYGNG